MDTTTCVSSSIINIITASDAPRSKKRLHFFAQLNAASTQQWSHSSNTLIPFQTSQHILLSNTKLTRFEQMLIKAVWMRWQRAYSGMEMFGQTSCEGEQLNKWKMRWSPRRHDVKHSFAICEASSVYYFVFYNLRVKRGNKSRTLWKIGKPRRLELTDNFDRGSRQDTVGCPNLCCQHFSFSGILKM